MSRKLVGKEEKKNQIMVRINDELYEKLSLYCHDLWKSRAAVLYDLIVDLLKKEEKKIELLKKKARKMNES